MLHYNWAQSALEGVKAEMNQYTKVFGKCCVFSMTLFFDIEGLQHCGRTLQV